MLCITYCPTSFAQIIPTHTNFCLSTVLLSLPKLEKGLGNRFSSVHFSHSLRPHGLHYSAWPQDQASLSFTNSWSLLKLISIKLVMPSNHLILCRPLLLPPSILPISQFFPSGGQSIGVSASTSVLPMNIQDWFPSGWTGLISLQSKELSRVFSNTTVQNHQFFSAQLSL